MVGDGSTMRRRLRRACSALADRRRRPPQAQADAVFLGERLGPLRGRGDRPPRAPADAQKPGWRSSTTQWRCRSQTRRTCDPADRRRRNVRLVGAGDAQRAARAGVTHERLIYLVPMALVLGLTGLAASSGRCAAASMTTSRVPLPAVRRRLEFERRAAPAPKAGENQPPRSGYRQRRRTLTRSRRRVACRVGCRTGNGCLMSTSTIQAKRHVSPGHGIDQRRAAGAWRSSPFCS